MAKYVYTVTHTDHTGERVKYEFRAASLTRRQINDALDEADEDDSRDPVMDIAFLGAKADGEEVEDMDDLPMEVLTTALQRHPSFRSPDQNQRRRRSR